MAKHGFPLGGKTNPLTGRREPPKAVSASNYRPQAPVKGGGFKVSVKALNGSIVYGRNGGPISGKHFQEVDLTPTIVTAIQAGDLEMQKPTGAATPTGTGKTVSADTSEQAKAT